jgi:hypothetical protein
MQLTCMFVSVSSFAGFSIQTRYPILYTAAYATSQQLLHVLERRKEEHGLKRLHITPPEPPLYHRDQEEKDAIEEEYEQEIADAQIAAKKAPASALSESVVHQAEEEVNAEVKIIKRFEERAEKELIEAKLNDLRPNPDGTTKSKAVVKAKGTPIGHFLAPTDCYVEVELPEDVAGLHMQ